MNFKFTEEGIWGTSVTIATKENQPRKWASTSQHLYRCWFLSNVSWSIHIIQFEINNHIYTEYMQTEWSGILSGQFQNSFLCPKSSKVSVVAAIQWTAEDRTESTVSRHAVDQRWCLPSIDRVRCVRAATANMLSSESLNMEDVRWRVEIHERHDASFFTLQCKSPPICFHMFAHETPTSVAVRNEWKFMHRYK